MTVRQKTICFYGTLCLAAERGVVNPNTYIFLMPATNTIFSSSDSDYWMFHLASRGDGGDLALREPSAARYSGGTDHPASPQLTSEQGFLKCIEFPQCALLKPASAAAVRCGRDIRFTLEKGRTKKKIQTTSYFMR